MLGRRPGRVPSQGETLAELFEAAGQPVMATSTVANPLGRAGRVALDLYRWRAAFDVVVVMVFSGRAFAHADLASAMGRRLGKKVVLHLHGGNLPAFATRHPGWVRRVLARADAVVAPSAYLAGTLGHGRAGVVVIPNALPLRDYVHRERRGVRPRLLWMRAFEPLYRPWLALDVLAGVRRRLPEATLTMAGPDAGLGASTARRAAEMGLGGSVEFPGVLDLTGKARALASHDILITTSSVDNAPVSVLEAAASGLPVVAASVGGLPHLLVDGEEGLLVTDGDAGAMAGAVVRLVGDPELAGHLSRNGRRLAERSDWTCVRPQWETLFARLVDGR
jgi:glycosyltransferase involved in cell wall biosynthesis